MFDELSFACFPPQLKMFILAEREVSQRSLIPSAQYILMAAGGTTVEASEVCVLPGLYITS